MTQEDLMNGATEGGLEADGVVRDAGDGDNNSRSDNPAGNSGDGAPADDVSQAELVRQFGDEFRRSMQAAIDRESVLEEGLRPHEAGHGERVVTLRQPVVVCDSQS